MEQEFEECVLCGKVTDVPIKLHVDFRPEYIEGCGQLCKECYNKNLKQ